ncbi:hypothetical protein Bbelb_029180 [Branchiostoma belcheri]|nr:hypothetical protein Bbelb_029180 [Branchiostoma belcheri]
MSYDTYKAQDSPPLAIVRQSYDVYGQAQATVSESCSTVTDIEYNTGYSVSPEVSRAGTEGRIARRPQAVQYVYLRMHGATRARRPLRDLSPVTLAELCWSVPLTVGTQILVLLRHFYTNAKPKFIADMDRRFNARHRSSNPVSARKTLATAPAKFVQRLIAARATLAKQRWSSVQDFCVGLAAPSVHELASSDAKL